MLGERTPQSGRTRVSYPTFRDWGEQLESFEALSIASELPLTLIDIADPVRLRGLLTSSTYFGIHGIQPLHGRLYDATDDRLGAAKVVVLSHQFWQDVFGGRADVVGETIQVYGGSTIVGVLPPGATKNVATANDYRQLHAGPDNRLRTCGSTRRCTSSAWSSTPAA